eukprot:TRINITY_DN12762_c0_g1_i2.p1 TRINITY_DN12762_c0_g1~~TRINITY_DN12762_c0_g1_i2.p1  ORF type:complete len:971 (-),score=115.61 TRINITY_DN12762_c0_g1_i2:70-2982(-)
MTANDALISACLGGIHEAEVILAGVRKSLSVLQRDVRVKQDGNGDVMLHSSEVLHAAAEAAEGTGPAEPPLTTTFHLSESAPQSAQVALPLPTKPMTLNVSAWKKTSLSFVGSETKDASNEVDRKLEQLVGPSGFCDALDRTREKPFRSADEFNVSPSHNDQNIKANDANQSTFARRSDTIQSEKTTLKKNSFILDQIHMETLIANSGDAQTQEEDNLHRWDYRKGSQPEGSVSLVFKDFCVSFVFSRFPVVIIHPDSHFSTWWLGIGMLFILVEAFSMPFLLSFDVPVQGALLVSMTVMNIFFLSDILVNFSTGIYAKNGSLILCPHELCKRYVKSWFLFDLMTAIPWEWVVNFSGSEDFSQSMRMLRFARMLRLTRLFKLVKFKVLNDKLNSIIESSEALGFCVGVARVLVLLYGVTHWAACGFYLVGIQGKRKGKPCWLDHNLVSGVPENDVSCRYLFALYFTLTTMTTVGYGDITASNVNEAFFVLGLLCVASVVFAGLMGTLMSLVSSLQLRSQERQEKRLVLSRYMTWRDVPRKLKTRIKSYLNFIWEDIGGFDEYENDIKALLPPVLGSELCYHVYGHILHWSPFLGWMQNEAFFVKDLAANVNTIFLVCGDTVFRMGMPNEQIYVLIDGQLFLSQSMTNQVRGATTQATDLNDDPVKFESNSVLKKFSVPRCKDDGLIHALMVQRVLNAFQLPVGETAPTSAGTSLSRDDDVNEPVVNSELFGANALSEASAKLSFDDELRRHACIKMQRAWKRRKLTRKQQSDATSKSTNSAGSNSSSAKAKAAHMSPHMMMAKTVHSPAYLGESCLWVPLEEWDTAKPPKYLYSATARTRCELLHIARTAIHQTILRYPDLLEERFDAFRRTVTDRLMDFGIVGDIVQSEVPLVNWSEMDLAMPEQEASAMDQERRGTLLREMMPTPGRPVDPKSSPFGMTREGSRIIMREGSRTIMREGSRTIMSVPRK